VTAPTARTELPVILKTYDLVVWSCRHLARFPRSYRFTLGARLEGRLYDIQDGLIRAKYGREKAALLQAVNLDLELLRFQFRLAHELRCLNTDSYGYAARTVNEIGQMVGGWLRSVQQRKAAG
jgi:hypothetical protein